MARSNARYGRILLLRLAQCVLSTKLCLFSGCNGRLPRGAGLRVPRLNFSRPSHEPVAFFFLCPQDALSIERYHHQRFYGHHHEGLPVCAAHARFSDHTSWETSQGESEFLHMLIRDAMAGGNISTTRGRNTPSCGCVRNLPCGFTAVATALGCQGC